MGLFNKIRSRNNQQPNAEQINNTTVTSGYDTLKNEVPFAGDLAKAAQEIDANVSEPEPINPDVLDHREKKLVRALAWGDSSHFDILNDIPPEQYANVLRRIKSGFYHDGFFQDIINHIPDHINKETGETRRNLYAEAVKSLREKADTYTQISRECSVELLQKAQIDGDPFPIDDQDQKLTPEFLAKNNLAPRYELQLEGLNINLSKSFRVKGHDSIIAYIETPNGEVKTRAYYRSNSAGLWRYCPDYAYNDGYNIWYGKGYNEEALTLPFELQKRLDSINEMGYVKPENPHAAELCFFGTSKRYANGPEYFGAKSAHQLRGDYYKETNRQPYREYGFYPDEKIPPETLDITGPDAPNFHQEISSYQAHNKRYGDFTTKLFNSYDQRLRYFMCETEDDGVRKAWLGGAETTASIGSTGCRTEWVYMGDFSTPINEYPKQAKGYEDLDDNKGPYVGMWKNYLSRMPFIQRYLKETARQ